MIYSTENIIIQELCLVLEDGKLVVKMSTAELQHAFLLLSLSYFPSPAVPTRVRADSGWERAAWIGSTKLSISAAHTFMDRASLTHCAPSLSSCSKHLLVNKTLLWQTLPQWGRVCPAENVTNVGDMLEEGVLGQHCSAPWQERRIVMATALQPESCSDNKLQQITLEVRGTSQKSFSWTRSPFPQTDVAAVLTLCQWAQLKISPHTAHSPLYSLGVLSKHPTPTHTLPQSLSPLCFTGNK